MGDGIEMRLTEPCGECPACRLRAQVSECLAHIDRQMIPPYLAALEELRAARRSDRDGDLLRALSRSASRRKYEWQESRARFLTPEVCRWITCERIGPIALIR